MIKRFIGATVSVAFVSSLAVASTHSFAGAADVVSSDGNTMKFEYQGDKLRITPGNDQNSYMVLRDGRIYVVTDSNGQKMVIDANQAMGMFGGMAGAAAPSSLASEVVKLEATGRMETHAGISGEVYDLEYISEDGKTQRGELVLSEDERAKEFSHALSGMARSLSKTAGKNFEDASSDMQKRLEAMDMGVLRYGEDMRLSAISERSIDQSRFVLPVEPTDLSNIGALMNQSRQAEASGQTKSSSGQKSGGVMGSFLEVLGGGDSSSKGASDAAGAEDGDGAAEEKDDNALGKAFGKLFGN
jgi:hypothetical protein